MRSILLLCTKIPNKQVLVTGFQKPHLLICFIILEYFIKVIMFNIPFSVRPGSIDVAKRAITIPESIGKVLIPLVRVGGTDGTIQIQYRTVDGTARGQLDYVPSSGVVVFNEGERRKIVEIIVINDDIREPVEQFQLQFFNSSAAAEVINFRRLTTAFTTTVTILDDDSK